MGEAVGLQQALLEAEAIEGPLVGAFAGEVGLGGVESFEEFLGSGEREVMGKDDDLLLVASKGGAPDHPLWYLNLDANREVEVQVKGDVFAATAHDATGDEKVRLWSLMTDIWPNYDAYQERTDRDIPLVVLTPKS